MSLHNQEKEHNRKMLFKIVSSIKYLAQQGLALRGDADEEDGNFFQLLRVRGENGPHLLEWLN